MRKFGICAGIGVFLFCMNLSSSLGQDNPPRNLGVQYYRALFASNPGDLYRVKLRPIQDSFSKPIISRLSQAPGDQSYSQPALSLGKYRYRDQNQVERIMETYFLVYRYDESHRDPQVEIRLAYLDENRIWKHRTLFRYRSEIFTLSPTGFPPVFEKTRMSKDEGPKFSPDGRHLVFSSFQVGSPDPNIQGAGSQNILATRLFDGDGVYDPNSYVSPVKTLLISSFTNPQSSIEGPYVSGGSVGWNVLQNSGGSFEEGCSLYLEPQIKGSCYHTSLSERVTSFAPRMAGVRKLDSGEASGGYFVDGPQHTYFEAGTGLVTRYLDPSGNEKQNLVIPAIEPTLGGQPTLNRLFHYAGRLTDGPLLIYQKQAEESFNTSGFLNIRENNVLGLLLLPDQNQDLSPFSFDPISYSRTVFDFTPPTKAGTSRKSFGEFDISRSLGKGIEKDQIYLMTFKSDNDKYGPALSSNEIFVVDTMPLVESLPENTPYLNWFSLALEHWDPMQGQMVKSKIKNATSLGNLVVYEREIRENLVPVVGTPETWEPQIAIEYIWVEKIAETGTTN